MLDPIKRKIEEASKRASSKFKSKILSDISSVIGGVFTYNTELYSMYEQRSDAVIKYLSELSPKIKDEFYNEEFTNYKPMPIYYKRRQFVFIHNSCIFVLNVGGAIGVIIYGVNSKVEGRKLDKYVNETYKENINHMIFTPCIRGDINNWVSNLTERARFRFDRDIFSYKNGIIKAILDTHEENVNDVREYGLPYNTVILLHGESGTGKTAIIEAMGNYMEYNIRNFNSTNLPITLADFIRYLNIDNSKNIIVIDNIDEIVDEDYSKFNTIMKCIDRLDRHIIVYTTRNYDKLSPDVIKRLKLTYTIETDMFDYNLAVQMCHRLEEDPIEVLKDVEFPINPSKLKHYILDYRMNRRRLRGE